MRIIVTSHFYRVAYGFYIYMRGYSTAGTGGKTTVVSPDIVMPSPQCLEFW